jgi:hypothetical protein
MDYARADYGSVSDALAAAGFQPAAAGSPFLPPAIQQVQPDADVVVYIPTDDADPDPDPDPDPAAPDPAPVPAKSAVPTAPPATRAPQPTKPPKPPKPTKSTKPPKPTKPPRRAPDVWGAPPAPVAPPPGGGRAGALIQALSPATAVRVPLDASTAAGGSHRGQSRSWKVPAAARQACVFAFDLMFEPGFYFQCQGKVGGMSIGRGKSSGCGHSPTAASHRLMWRPDAAAQSYVYVPSTTYAQQPPPLDRAGRYKCGLGMFGDVTKGALAAGAWHRVEIGTRLNTPGRRDGALFLGVDGRYRSLEGVVWRTAADQVINDVFFGFFFGGGCTGRAGAVSYRNPAVHAWA